MKRPLGLVRNAAFSVISLVLAVIPVAAEEGIKEAALKPLLSEAGESPAAVEEERQVETLEQKGGFLGYDFLSVDGYGGRALQYGYLHSSASGGLMYRKLQKETNFELEGNFLNEKDYQGDLSYDYRGDYRLHLRTESLFHNLDRQTLFSPNIANNGVDFPVQAAQQDAGARYGVAVSQNLAAFRYRLHNYPLHVNLGYWSLEREGDVQQRFADIGTAGETVYAQARRIDRVTQEGSVGLDAHLGPLDLIYAFQVRVFGDRAAIPSAFYLATDGRSAGLQQHNEDPDSRFISHTVKVHTSLADGIVGSASYTYGERENLSNLSDTLGVKHYRATLQNGAGDLTYTPCKEFSAALKYRRQQVDRDDRGEIRNLFFAQQLQTVKPGIDTAKDSIIATLSLRPRHDLSLVGEVKSEFLTRSNVSSLPSFSAWGLPEHSATETGSLALLYRPVKGGRISAKYSYRTTDHPSYGASAQQSHRGDFLASFTRTRWGANANLFAKREWNDRVHSFVIASETPLTFAPYPGPLMRDRSSQNANVSFWFTPVQSVTLSANYAYLRAVTNQDVLFTQEGAVSEAPAAFTTHSRVYGVNASFAATDRLDLSLNLQQTRSDSAFEPAPITFSPSAVAGNDTLGISDITAQDTVISTLSARGEYRFSKEMAASLQYDLSDYNEKKPAFSGYNGTVHAVVAYLSAKW